MSAPNRAGPCVRFLVALVLTWGLSAAFSAANAFSSDAFVEDVEADADGALASEPAGAAQTSDYRHCHLSGMTCNVCAAVVLDHDRLTLPREPLSRARIAAAQTNRAIRPRSRPPKA